MTVADHIAQQPALVQNWIQFMGLVNMTALLFFVVGLGRGLLGLRGPNGTFKLYYWEGMVMLVAAAISSAFMDYLFAEYGYTRILGLAHVVFWTPAVAWLALRLKKGTIPIRSIFGGYIALLVATNTTSLVIDYIDVARYLLGDTGIVGPAA
ncbi:MAG: hypothetical protein ACPG06_02190 [Alphaproteobacteria bacterium]